MNRIYKSMIFAAGLGTRLKPLTDSMPKALVPVGGKPLLEHTLLKLRNAGITETVINVHHFADMIEEWLATVDWISLNCMSEGKMTVHVSDERKLLLETGGGILHARKHLEGCGRFLVHNVDILSDADISSFCSNSDKDALASLLMSDRESRRHFLFEKESMRLVGWNDSGTGETLMSDNSVNPSDCIPLAFSGIHILSDKVFEVMEDYVAEKGIPDSESGCRFAIRDFYIHAAKRYDIKGVFRKGLRLMDVGKADTLAKADEFLLSVSNAGRQM
ncbi:MAG: sugar phosphate nucleotidyltransferase [Candidatus Cryptobacteroides sp.]